MHEQKLLEVSLTQELLDAEIAGMTSTATAEILRGDKGTLARMEGVGALRRGDGTRFGVHLRVHHRRLHHYFMEMNTRIRSSTW